MSDDFAAMRARGATEHDILLRKCDEFLLSCDIGMPTPDACAQLADAFLPALKIMIERGYDENGATWKREGYMPLLFELYKKVKRLVERMWRRGKRHDDSTIDIINYGGFLYRSSREPRILPWGDIGKPHDFGDDDYDQ